MQPTVRDAVFGNVGTMMSFRVSADDAPTLAKPFAPQFTPEDLLQMHNRHFVMSIVIKGEKAPAFSATTLTIPPNQTDFTPQIIENTRRFFAKPRNEVETMIKELVNQSPLQPAPVPVANQTPKPQSTQSTRPNQSTTRPIRPETDKAAKISHLANAALGSVMPKKPAAPNNNNRPQNQPTNQSSNENSNTQQKRSRNRRRKKPSGSPDGAQPPQQQPQSQQTTSHETEIRLR
jgi:hypothetical protein